VSRALRLPSPGAIGASDGRGYPVHRHEWPRSG